MSEPIVADAMLHAPKVHPAGATVAEVLKVLDNDHVHAVLLVEGGALVGVVERRDLAGAEASSPARLVARLADRVVAADAPLDAVHKQMLASGRRRLAVVDAGALVGLLCLKRRGSGFCTDEGVQARAAERFGERAMPA